MSLEEKSLTDDKIYCKSVSKSLSDIIRFSLDEEFRKKCFELYKVCSTQETENEIERRLMRLVESENVDFTDTQKDEITLENLSEDTSSGKDNKNSENMQCTSQNNKETNLIQNMSTSNDIHAAHQNIFKRNWLKISSQQYKQIIKRRKLNYYSQPQFSKRYYNDIEFFSSSNSQTSSSSSSLALEEKVSLTDPLKDTVTYCQEKFRDSFTNNAQKYFKKNLKSYRHVSGSQ